ncbi:MAG TPA: DUF4176 domain-containing protein [Clostridia bacterium]|nr:DUF4176 domain-containing protein [Clostridia bacterium]
MKTKGVIVALLVFSLLAGCSSANNNSSADTGVNANVNANSNPVTEQQTTEISFDGQELLPLGSVVLLKGGTKKVMICGRGQTKVDDSENTLYDYSACYYPEGIIDPKELFLFNNDDIDKVFYKGFEDDEELKFRKFAQEKMKELRGE